MTFSPDYGETPVDPEDTDALTVWAREVLGEPALKADVYDLEQAIESDVSARLLSRAYSSDGAVGWILNDHFVRALHAELYGQIWVWAGRFRIKEPMRNIGVEPTQIVEQMRSGLDNLLYRFNDVGGITYAELGLYVHAEVVRIHPFVDGNGRTTRLLADLVIGSEPSESVRFYDWSALVAPETRRAYIAALRHYDRTGQIDLLIEVVPIETLGPIVDR